MQGIKRTRHRVPKACLVCRCRKTRCDVPIMGARCLACEKRDTNCVYKGSAQQRPTRYLEERQVQSSDSSLIPLSTGLDHFPNFTPVEQDTPQTILGPCLAEGNTILEADLSTLAGLNAQFYPVDPIRPIYPPEPTPGRIFDDFSRSGDDDLLNLPCFAVPKYLMDQPGPGTSTFSMISPEGIQWINQKVGHETFQEEASTPQFHGSRGGYSVQTPEDIYSDLGFVPLPSKEAAISLFNAYFRTINHYCPLFDEHDFMSRVEQEYPVHPQSSPEWWACVSVTLALACTLDPRYYQHGWIYLRNSMLSLNGFYVGRPQLCSVQAVLGMALYFLGTFSLRPSIELNALAMCMAYSLDLSTDLSTQTASEIEQSRKVLAVCCSMDIDIALRSRTPPIQHSIDMTFYHRPIDQNGVFNIYDSVRHLTIIKNQIYQKLYSTLGSEKGDAEVIETVGELDAKLQDWVDEIPHEYQPGHFNRYSDSRNEIGSILLYIHLSYYNCLLIVHRKAIARADWNMSLDPCRNQFPQVRSPNPRTLQSSTLCTQAARASMQLVREIPGDNITCAGTLMYFAVFALVIFSILIVKDPSVANPKRDIELMQDVEKFFFAVSRSNAGPGIDRLIQYCISHRAAAEMAIKRALKSTTGHC